MVIKSQQLKYVVNHAELCENCDFEQARRAANNRVIASGFATNDLVAAMALLRWYDFSAEMSDDYRVTKAETQQNSIVRSNIMTVLDERNVTIIDFHEEWVNGNAETIVQFSVPA